MLGGAVFQKLFENAASLNERAIISLAEFDPKAVLLDVGCGPGELTARLAARISPKRIIGIEIDEEFAQQARQKGITVINADLNQASPLDDESITVFHANQVIEHLYNSDIFIDEMYRVLQPRGYGIVSTENLASWHNIGSLILGWQPFSETNISNAKLGIGNPLALHRNEASEHDSMRHVRVVARKGLIELFEAKGFAVEKVIGSGYYPLPSVMGRIDSRHAAFIAIKMRKR
jgi:2-polyprenyl-3-methyl-5-hydroxy-6-metoxy-1,4-benzoquinol methylase